MSQRIPSSLFRYTAFNERTISLIVNSVVYFSESSAFNDPFDCRNRLSYKGTDEQWRRLLPTLIEAGWMEGLPPDDRLASAERLLKGGAFNDEKMHEQFYKAFLQKLDEEVGILCLSACRSHILMWSHYADGHRGCCLEFDTQALGGEPGPAPISYASKYPRVNFHEAWDAREMMIRAMVFTKAGIWKHEEEWRAINPQGPGLYRFPPEALKGIILGSRMKDEHKLLIWKLVKDRKPPVHLAEAKPKQANFELKIVPVDMRKAVPPW